LLQLQTGKRDKKKLNNLYLSEVYQLLLVGFS